jgi:hypothetical protein
MQGAMHLLGLDTKTAAEATATLQSLMAISSGIEGIVALEGTMDALSKRLPIVNSLMKTFQMLMKPGPLLLIGAAVTAIYIGYTNMTEELHRTEKAQKAVNDVMRKATAGVEKQRVEIEFYKGIINDTTKSEDERYAALDRLKELVPTLANNEINNANALAKTNTELNDYIKNAVIRAQIDALIAKRAENNNKIADITSGKLSDNASFADKATAAFKSFATGTSYTMQLTAESADGLGRSLSDLTTENTKLDEELKSLEGQIGKTANAQKKYQQDANLQKPGAGKSAAPKIKVPIEVVMAGDLQSKIDISKVIGKESKPLALELDVDLRVKNLRGRVGQLVDDINSALDSGIKQMAINMAGALGDLAMNIVAGAEDPLAKFGDALLSTLAGFMQTLGQAMMAAGLASQKFQALLFTQPAGAIIAGAALIVAAGAVKGIMQKGIEGRQSKGSTAPNNQPQGIRPFADGGIISGPTLGLMGEYPGARSNPEVVAPLNKLKDMIGGGGNLTTRVSGQDLLIMLDRAETNRGRVR